jgi:hypothetical protein
LLFLYPYSSVTWAFDVVLLVSGLSHVHAPSGDEGMEVEEGQIYTEEQYPSSNACKSSWIMGRLLMERKEVNESKMAHSPLYQDSTLCNLLLGEEGPIEMELG